jgi:hypothetical protein
VQASRTRMIQVAVLSATLTGVVAGWQVRMASAQVDASLSREERADDAPAQVAARARASASDLASSLSWVASSLRTASPPAMANGQVTPEENDALIESAAKAQLLGMAEELDQLSAMLSSAKNPEGTRAMLQRLRGRAATLSRLGQRTNQPLIPSEMDAELMKLWSDVEKLSTSTAVVAAPADDSQVGIETLE